MIYDSMDIGAWQLKLDTGGNTYGQIQWYYVAVVQSLQQARSPVLALSCVPMLYMELSAAILRVCGAATLQHQFLCEPLTPAPHLYCVNNPAHMDAVVRCVSAIRRMLTKLAIFHQQLAAQASPTQFQQAPRARLPYYFATAYPEASVQQLLSQTRLIFLVTTNNGQQRLVKFVPCCQNRSQGGTQAHRAWARCPVCSRLGRQFGLCLFCLAKDVVLLICLALPYPVSLVAGMSPFSLACANHLWHLSFSFAIIMYQCRVDANRCRRAQMCQCTSHSLALPSCKHTAHAHMVSMEI